MNSSARELLGATASDGASRPRTMSRLRAERVVAGALRLPLVESRETLSKEPLGKVRTAAQLVTGVAASTPHSHDSYLQHTGIVFLLEDVLKQVQDEKPDQVARFIANYFDNAAHGRNVRGREFDYVNGTLQNKVSFLTMLQRGLANADTKMEITSDDFAELVWCYCSDLPRSLLEQASFHVNETPDGRIVASIREFLTAFAACFIYHDFLTRVSEIYTELVQATRDNRQPVSGGTSSHSDSVAVAMAADRVVARLRHIAQQSSNMMIPPLAEVEVFVFKSSNFKEFCAAFFHSAAIASVTEELQQAFTCLSESDNTPI